jgi:hypothetical protein
MVCPLDPFLNVLEVQLSNREVARGEVILVLNKVVGVSPSIIADAGDGCMSICIGVVVSRALHQLVLVTDCAPLISPFSDALSQSLGRTASPKHKIVHSLH